MSAPDFDPDPQLPPPPEKPEPDECCGSGCNPCILDLYEDELNEWRRRCEQICAARRPDGGRHQ